MAHRANAEVNALVDNFAALVRAARIGDTVRNSHESLQIDVHASRIGQAGEVLLTLTSELKQTALLSNFRSINQAVHERVDAFDQHATARARALQVVSNEVQTTLRQLEEHYYASASRPSEDPAPTAELCDRLQDLERTVSAASPIMSTLR